MLLADSTYDSHRRRRAVSGIIGAVVLFALVFTAGAGFFITVNNYRHSVDVVNAGRESFVQQASSENLAMVARLSKSADPWGNKSDLFLSIANAGGVSSTVVGVFVSAPNGSIVSTSTVHPPSHFLSAYGDLNLSLPLTLVPGTNASQLRGCVKGSDASGCDIGISHASFIYANGTYVVSVLTSLGNVFSVEYPAPHFTTLKNFYIVQPSSESLEVVDQSLVNQYLLDETGVVGCYGCFTNVAAGGNILVTLIMAGPSPVQDDNSINVIATVSNYSPYGATEVAVSLNTLYSGPVSVSPSAPSGSPVSCPPTTGGTTTSIAAGASATFECSFVAVANPGPGTVTFAGTASGTVDGAPVSSSVASSNPVQIGSIVMIGLWQPNYYYFDYTAGAPSSQHTPSPASVIPHSDSYVALDVEVTNIYNEPLTLLDGSYIQFVSPGTDIDEYIVQSVQYTGTTGTITQYGCTTSSGPSCIVVQPGQSVDLVFAACGAGSATWQWQSGPNLCGGTIGYPIGNSVDIILEYAFQTSYGVNLYAENIPFQSVFIS